MGYAGATVLWLGLYASRHERIVLPFVVCAFPYAAYAWLQSPWRRRLSERFQGWENTALMACTILLFFTSASAARLIQGGVNAEEAGYVKDACDFIEAHHIQGPFYNDYKFGSYWIWRFKGNPGVFQDGRQNTVEGYGELIDACLEAQRSPSTWNAYVRHLGIRAALVRNPARSRYIVAPVFEKYFPKSSWKLVYHDDLCLLFVRYNKGS